MYVPPRGRVSLDGEDVTIATVAYRRAHGLSYIPEDRQDEGSAPDLSIAENIAATQLRPPIARAGWLSLSAMRAYALTLIAKFDVRGADPEAAIGTLSGGNMQKVIISREFSSSPKLLMVSQPTRGVDVGAMEFVHNSIVQARDAGAGVLLFSADLSEVMSLSDRLLVMYRGQIVAEFTQENLTEIAVGLAMAGIKPTPEALAEATAARQRIVAELEATGKTLVEDSADAVHSESLEATSVVIPFSAAAVTPVRRDERPRPNFFADFASKTFRGAAQPVIAVLVALAVGALIILLIGHNPLTAYAQLFGSGWSTPYGIGSIIAMFIPLAIMSAGTIISFRAGFFNIAGEGSLYFGAFFGAWVGFTFHGLPPVLAVILILVVGTLAGALWSLIPGMLYAFWRVDIIVTTLLLSTVATLITNFLVTGPFQDKFAGAPASPKLDDAYNLTMFNPSYGIGPDLILALIVAVAIGFLLQRTTWGLKIKQLGAMNRFAEYSGVSVKAMAMQALTVSGAAAGIAGALYVIGPNGGRFLQAFSPGFGFLAITVALLARLNPWASILAALFYATMMGGTTGLQTAGVPFPIVNVLQGLIIIAITAIFIVNSRRRMKLMQRAPEPVRLDKAPLPVRLDRAPERVQSDKAEVSKGVSK